MCEVCEKDCKTPYYLQLHLSTKHEAAKFTCLRCQRSFKWKQSYRKHMALHHGEARMISVVCILWYTFSFFMYRFTKFHTW